MRLQFNVKTQQNEGVEPCNCPDLGKEINILSFNYDGFGTASAIVDGVFKEITLMQIRTIMNSGWYTTSYEKEGYPKFTSDRFLLIPFPNGFYNLDENYELTNLDNNPILTYLLKNYISNAHQENANYSTESIWAEYIRLKENNQLNLLFTQEGGDNGIL